MWSNRECEETLLHKLWNSTSSIKLLVEIGTTFNDLMGPKRRDESRIRYAPKLLRVRELSRMPPIEDRLKLNRRFLLVGMVVRIPEFEIVRITSWTTGAEN